MIIIVLPIKLTEGIIIMAEKKKAAIKETQTQTQIIGHIAEQVSLTRKQVGTIFQAVAELASRHISKNGSGEFKIPHLGIKIMRKTKPATKKRKGINPATGAAIEIAAKPKRDVVKLVALKALKDVLEK